MAPTCAWLLPQKEHETGSHGRGESFTDVVVWSPIAKFLICGTETVGVWREPIRCLPSLVRATDSSDGDIFGGPD